jgi:hypothetical protein
MSNILMNMELEARLFMTTLYTYFLKKTAFTTWSMFIIKFSFVPLSRWSTPSTHIVLFCIQLLNKPLLSTLQLLNVALVSISSSNSFKKAIGVNQNVLLIQKARNSLIWCCHRKFINYSLDIQTSVWSYFLSKDRNYLNC